MRTHARTCQRGLTLVELMVALAVGLLVVLAAGAMLHNARNAYHDIDDAGRVQETGRMATAHLADALHQANHLPWESVPPTAKRPALPPGLRGIDDSRQADDLDPALGRATVATGNGVNKSDILMLGFFGAPRHAGGVVNCSGAAVADGPLEAAARSWVIYYIAPGKGGEPELRCRYQGKHGGWTSDAVARGVEAMQLRYAIDGDADGRPERWLDAGAMDEADWRRVKLVRLALLVRGSRRRPAAVGSPARSYPLLPSAGRDDAQRFVEKDGEQRLRAVFQTTILLRNAADDRAPP
jgi:type IV pilus assembly protein PilW